MTKRCSGSPYVHDAEVMEVVRKFESCEFTPSDFNHRLHLIVSLSYLLKYPEQEALSRLRQGINKFLKHHGIDANVYHETLTLFWMRRVNSFLVSCVSSRPLAGLANELIETCGDSRIVYDYYSQELIASEAARIAWAEPDLRALDF
ncbi:MAG: hypothetical protein WCD76_19910 [Pyrinomonadaceae bacterium]